MYPNNIYTYSYKQTYIIDFKCFCVFGIVQGACLLDEEMFGGLCYKKCHGESFAHPLSLPNRQCFLFSDFLHSLHSLIFIQHATSQVLSFSRWTDLRPPGSSKHLLQHTWVAWRNGTGRYTGSHLLPGYMESQDQLNVSAVPATVH